MNVVCRIEGLEFEWDGNKAESNFQKHGVRFEEAAEAFLDPFYQIGDASRQGEERRFILGYSLTPRLLLAVYVERGTRTRIISAQIATRSERYLYEQS
ncbi:MAG: BrnT family toxin [Leptolyngbyaceae cyanobacterium SM2_5_2]|nr:BrnT family toxin [Leptolyngbyaceae cyanobacterium SM2_5_2]